MAISDSASWLVNITKHSDYILSTSQSWYFHLKGHAKLITIPRNLTHANYAYKQQSVVG